VTTSKGTDELRAMHDAVTCSYTDGTIIIIDDNDTLSVVFAASVVGGIAIAKAISSMYRVTILGSGGHEIVTWWKDGNRAGTALRSIMDYARRSGR